MKEPQYKPNALSSAMISQCTNNIWHGRTSSTCFYRFTLFYGKMIDAIFHKVENLNYSVFVATDKEKSVDDIVEKGRWTYSHKRTSSGSRRLY